MNERIPRLRRAEGTDAITDALDQLGAVIVVDMLDDAPLARIADELGPAVAEADPEREHLNPAVAWFFGKQTRHLTGLAGHSPTFARELLCHPTLLAVCDRVLGPSCAAYQLNVGHLLDRGPGAEAQLLHRDEVVWNQLPSPHPEVQVASITALVDFTAENGATCVVPGSHRWPRERVPRPEEVVAAEMPAGASVVYLGSTIHGGGANRTADVRRLGLHLSYCLGWLRTEENNVLATPPEIARTLPLRAQELLGYGAHDAIASGGGFLGLVDLRDPVAMLADGSL